MSLFKIIKSAEVRENMLQALPLRRFTPEEELRGAAETAAGGEPDAGAVLQSQAVAWADDIMSRARAAADEIISRARAESEQIKEEARREAFDRGLREGAEQGYREGLANAGAEAEAIRGRAREVLARAEEIRRRTLEALEGEIVELAREIAEKLVAKQLALDPDTVLGVAKEALGLVADRLNVVLYVNPAEAALVEGKREELLSLLPARAEIKTVADQSVSPGGCRVETEQGRVDATMEKRREELLKALYGEQ